MSNVYLVKIAGYATKIRHTEAGRATNALDFRSPIAGKRPSGTMTNESLLASLGSSKKMYAQNTGEKVTTAGKEGFLGFGKKPGVTANAGKTRMTGDVLAKDTIQDRLAAKRKAATVSSEFARATGKNVPATGAKGILQKAVGLAKKHPIAAVGMGAAAAGYAAGKSSDRKEQQVYY